MTAAGWGSSDSSSTLSVNAVGVGASCSGCGCKLRTPQASETFHNQLPCIQLACIVLEASVQSRGVATVCSMQHSFEYLRADAMISECAWCLPDAGPPWIR